jgi:hypothetical protein
LKKDVRLDVVDDDPAVGSGMVGSDTVGREAAVGRVPVCNKDVGSAAVGSAGVDRLELDNTELGWAELLGNEDKRDDELLYFGDIKDEEDRESRAAGGRDWRELV